MVFRYIILLSYYAHESYYISTNVRRIHTPFKIKFVLREFGFAQNLSQPNVLCCILVTFVNCIPNFNSLAHTVPEILLNYTENRQKVVKCRQPLHRSYPKVSRILVTFDGYIPNFKCLALIVLEIFSLQTDTHTRTNG
jgi:hypothetical protein